MKGGADPDGLGLLAMALEWAADDLESRRRRLVATPVSGAGLAPVVDWLRRQTADVRRRAVLAGAAGKGWRHRSTFDHVWGLGRAAATGMGDGLLDIVRGAGAVAELHWYSVTDPAKAVQMGPATIERAARTTVEQVLGVDALRRDVAYGRAVWTEGFWPATEDLVHDTYEQVPGAALTIAGAVSGAAIVRVASNASYLPALAPAGATSGARPTLLRLSVPAGNGGDRVALDPADGRFVVFTEGAVVRRTGWRGLDGDERAALKGAGIVDRKGHLRDEGE